MAIDSKYGFQPGPGGFAMSECSRERCFHEVVPNGNFCGDRTQIPIDYCQYWPCRIWRYS
eukprot:1571284-Rhodomonas_salina.1